jgi:hypothetical protein
MVETESTGWTSETAELPSELVMVELGTRVHTDGWNLMSVYTECEVFFSPCNEHFTNPSYERLLHPGS